MSLQSSRQSWWCGTLLYSCCCWLDLPSIHHIAAFHSLLKLRWMKCNCACIIITGDPYGISWSVALHLDTEKWPVLDWPCLWPVERGREGNDRARARYLLSHLFYDNTFFAFGWASSFLLAPHLVARQWSGMLTCTCTCIYRYHWVCFASPVFREKRPQTKMFDVSKTTMTMRENEKILCWPFVLARNISPKREIRDKRSPESSFRKSCMTEKKRRSINAEWRQREVTEKVRKKTIFMPKRFE